MIIMLLLITAHRRHNLLHSGLTPEEVFIVKLTDAAGAEEVQKLMEARRDQIAATSQDYTVRGIAEMA